MSDIFCKIIQKKEPAIIIYESKKIIAFLDNEPFSNGHVLIAPKKHITELESADSEDLKEVIILSARLAKILKEMFNYDGILFYCTSGDKLQDVKHLHFHIHGKNRKQKGFYYQKFKNDEMKEKELQKTAVLIKRKLIGSSASN